MPNLTVLADTAENRALLNPVFREALTIITNAQEKYGINYFDYDSLEAFTYAYLASMETKALTFMKSALDSIGTPDAVLNAVLEKRRGTSG